MSIFTSLCSCLPIETGYSLIRQSYNSVISYLSNNRENLRVLEEEKFHEDYQEQCGLSVYEISKNNAVIVQEIQPQVQSQPQQHTILDQPEGFVYDPDWNNHQILQAKGEYDLRCLKSLLDTEPTNDGFEKILEEEENGIRIFHKQLLVEESKRINIYRYSFNLPINLKEYLEVFTTEELNKLDQNLLSWSLLETVSEDLVVCHAEYKKVLVIPPKDFVFLYYENFDQSTQTFYQLGSSVQSSLPLKEGVTRGLVHLAGYEVKQIGENKVNVEAYANIDIDLKINPSMVKQPTKNEIKKYIDRVIKKAAGSKEEQKVQKTQESQEKAEKKEEELLG